MEHKQVQNHLHLLYLYPVIIILILYKDGSRIRFIQESESEQGGR